MEDVIGHVVMEQPSMMTSYGKCHVKELLSNIEETRQSTENLLSEIKNRFRADEKQRREQIKLFNKRFDEEERSIAEKRRRAEINNREEERKCHETARKRTFEQRCLRKKYLNNDVLIELSNEDKADLQRLEEERCRKVEQCRREERRSLEIVQRVRCIQVHHQKRRQHYLKLMQEGVQYTLNQ